MTIHGENVILKSGVHFYFIIVVVTFLILASETFFIDKNIAPALKNDILAKQFIKGGDNNNYWETNNADRLANFINSKYNLSLMFYFIAKCTWMRGDKFMFDKLLLLVIFIFYILRTLYRGMITRNSIAIGGVFSFIRLAVLSTFISKERSLYNTGLFSYRHYVAMLFNNGDVESETQDSVESKTEQSYYYRCGNIIFNITMQSHQPILSTFCSLKYLFNSYKIMKFGTTNYNLYTPTSPLQIAFYSATKDVSATTIWRNNSRTPSQLEI